jgi:heme/copper-type cytochrome/quinol oxidase subunit 2
MRQQQIVVIAIILAVFLSMVVLAGIMSMGNNGGGAGMLAGLLITFLSIGAMVWFIFRARRRQQGASSAPDSRRWTRVAVMIAVAAVLVLGAFLIIILAAGSSGEPKPEEERITTYETGPAMRVVNPLEGLFGPVALPALILAVLALVGGSVWMAIRSQRSRRPAPPANGSQPPAAEEAGKPEDLSLWEDALRDLDDREHR